MACLVGISRYPLTRILFWQRTAGCTGGRVLHRDLTFEGATRLRRLESEAGRCREDPDTDGPRGFNEDWAVYVATGGAAGMKCMIGMAIDVSARVRTLKANGVVPKRARRSLIQTRLTYNRAVQVAADEIGACGGDCIAGDAGEFVSGRVWAVYRVDW